MVMKSSENLGTQQENTKESDLSSAKAKPAKPVATKTPKAEAVVTEVVTPEAAAEAIEADGTGPTLESYQDILADGRVRIDAIDDQLLELIVRRMEVANTLLSAKHVRRIDPRDKRRQAQIFNRLNGNAADLTADNGVNLNEHQIRELYDLFIRFGIESFRKNIIDGRRRR